MNRPEVLLLLPGLLCDAELWQAQVEMLAIQVTCLVPGYRASDSIVGMARAVLAQAPARFALAGHSMGGRVALEVVRLAPERVTRLALLDTGFESRPTGLAGEAEARERHRLLELARTRGLRVMGADWLRGTVHPARLEDPRLTGRILGMIERFTFERYRRQVQALLERPDATGVLGSITCPTLVACGRDDAGSPPARHERMATRIPGSVLEFFDNCGHMAPLERPQAVGRALSRWLQRGQ